MKIIEPYVEVWTFDPSDIMTRLELSGRVCYKSEDRIKPQSAERFLRNLVYSGHESVLEHCSITVKFVVDRGISHDLVRHRIAAYSQESTRYCRYGDEITVIKPVFWETSSVQYQKWWDICRQAEGAYIWLLKEGASPQQAKSVLPNSLKTELITTYNIREWRHVLKLRCSVKSHPQMRQATIPLLLHFREVLPALFADVSYDTDFPEKHYARILSIVEGR